MEAMKIMIGYDGSPHADAALADLGRAGLPRKVEAMVLSVSEEWIPAPAGLGGVRLIAHVNVIVAGDPFPGTSRMLVARTEIFTLD